MLNVRGIAEASAVWSGIPRVVAQGRRGRTLILAYHNVIPDAAPPAGDRSLHLPFSAFNRQLDMLVEHCDVVPLSAVLVDPPPRARPRVVITFDDAYHGALTIGAAALVARGLPATVFVPPAMLGKDSFWWDAFAGPDGLSAEFRAEALGPLQGDDSRVRAWAQEHGHAAQHPPSWLRPGTESELEGWVASRLGVAAHSWRHANLTRLADADLVDELTRPLAWLRERFANVVEPWVTYPYGLASPTTVDRARHAGYRGGLLVAGGWAPRPIQEPLALPRLNIGAGVSTRGFYLRLSGVFRGAVAPAQHLEVANDA